MKTNELTGAKLDWAVMKCRGLFWLLHGHIPYSTDWAEGGALIEKEKIELFIEDERWKAYSSNSLPQNFDGDTPLIAAMRCYVASKLGDDVDVPEDIV